MFGSEFKYSKKPAIANFTIFVPVLIKRKMYMQIGIVGLPQCGKSTLFQTITKTHLKLQFFVVGFNYCVYCINILKYISLSI